MATKAPASFLIGSNRQPPSAEQPAYAQVLLDFLRGCGALSVRADEAEQSWRVVTQCCPASADGTPPLLDYPAGASGPSPLGSEDRECS